MMFTRRLRERVRRGLIRCSVRFWTRPHVTVGGTYPMEDGFIVVESVERITARAITLKLARESGFESVADLLGVARHGQSDQPYLVRFRFTMGPDLVPVPPAAAAQKRKKRLTLTTKARF
jgi:hypothetical protein